MCARACMRARVCVSEARERTLIFHFLNENTCEPSLSVDASLFTSVTRDRRGRAAESETFLLCVVEERMTQRRAPANQLSVDYFNEPVQCPNFNPALWVVFLAAGRSQKKRTCCLKIMSVIGVRWKHSCGARASLSASYPKGGKKISNKLASGFLGRYILSCSLRMRFWGWFQFITSMILHFDEKKSQGFLSRPARRQHIIVMIIIIKHTK